eukprot:scaffold86130_cov52-Phaeocystis_antarctica.AAC.2
MAAPEGSRGALTRGRNKIRNACSRSASCLVLPAKFAGVPGGMHACYSGSLRPQRPPATACERPAVARHGSGLGGPSPRSLPFSPLSSNLALEARSL